MPPSDGEPDASPAPGEPDAPLAPPDDPAPALGEPGQPATPDPAEPGAEAPPDPELSSDGLVADCGRPYASASPWNTPIAAEAVYDANSEHWVSGLGDRLTSDPTQFTYPVYEISEQTPLANVAVTGWFSNVMGDGRTMDNANGVTVQMPIPPEAEAAAGSDGQVILVNPETGEEWGAWRFERSSADSYEAVNVYHYNTRWDGVPPPSSGGGVFVNRGAGVPYLAGLVRPCEIEAGKIEHALAFAYDSPSGDYVYPATKSDGDGSVADSPPEGARLQLDPSLTAADIEALGCRGPCRTVALALQEYGMVVIDNSGRSKVMLEYVGTAGWSGTVDENTVSPLPLDRFRVLDTRTISRDAGCTIIGTELDDVLVGTRSADVICGLDGNDELRGLAGNDVIRGGEGNDTILGGDGQDLLDGGAGADVVHGGDGRDVIDAGPGVDQVIAGRGNDRLLAADGEADMIDGGLGSDEAELDDFDRVTAVE